MPGLVPGEGWVDPVATGDTVVFCFYMGTICSWGMGYAWSLRPRHSPSPRVDLVPMKDLFYLKHRGRLCQIWAWVYIVQVSPFFEKCASSSLCKYHSLKNVQVVHCASITVWKMCEWFIVQVSQFEKCASNIVHCASITVCWKICKQ